LVTAGRIAASFPSGVSQDITTITFVCVPVLRHIDRIGHIDHRRSQCFVEAFDKRPLDVLWFSPPREIFPISRVGKLSSQSWQDKRLVEITEFAQPLSIVLTPIIVLVDQISTLSNKRLKVRREQIRDNLATDNIDFCGKRLCASIPEKIQGRSVRSERPSIKSSEEISKGRREEAKNDAQ
jgi:hypothetical protein